MDIRGMTARERLRSLIYMRSLARSLKNNLEDENEKGLVKKKLKAKRYGGASCAAYGCNNYYGERAKQLGITFHTFPWSKPDLVRKWERAMHRKDFKATVHSRVCSNHFTPDWFDRSGLRVRIKAGAVPSVFDLPGHPAHPVQHRKPPAEESNSHELTVTKTPESTTLLTSVECNRAKVLKPSLKSLRNYRNLINPTNGLISIGSKDIINFRNSNSINPTNGLISMGSKDIISLRNNNPTNGLINIGSKDITSLRNNNPTNGLINIGSKDVRSNLTIKPSTLKVCDGHNYSLPSPKVLLNKFNLMESAIARYKHSIRILRQKNRRLQRKVESLQRQPSD